MKKDITNLDSKGNRHGFNQMCDSMGQPWSRCNYQNGIEIGYEEWNSNIFNAIGEPGTEFIYHII